jgi:hypothetical protein
MCQRCIIDIIKHVSNAIVRIAIDALSYHLISSMVALGKVDLHGKVRHIPIQPKVFSHANLTLIETHLAPSTRAK